MHWLLHSLLLVFCDVQWYGNQSSFCCYTHCKSVWVIVSAKLLEWQCKVWRMTRSDRWKWCNLCLWRHLSGSHPHYHTHGHLESSQCSYSLSLVVTEQLCWNSWVPCSRIHQQKTKTGETTAFSFPVSMNRGFFHAHVSDIFLCNQIVVIVRRLWWWYGKTEVCQWAPDPQFPPQTDVISGKHHTESHRIESIYQWCYRVTDLHCKTIISHSYEHFVIHFYGYGLDRLTKSTWLWIYMYLTAG